MATGADLIAVACPFCMQMLESGLGSVPAAVERGVQVFDLAELLEMSIAYSRPAASTAGVPQPASADPPERPASEPPAP